VLMAQSGVDADEAFRLLVRASQRENRKLRAVAAQVAARARRPIDTECAR
jgi:AmiR/NasT family two-component response regulator